MITHIVFWRLHKQANGQDAHANALELKQQLEALAPVIRELQSIEVGLNLHPSEAACDVALLTRFASPEDLATYQTHPAHQAVVGFVRAIACERYVVDYES